MTLAGERLLHTHHEKDARSRLFVLDGDDRGAVVDLPPEATHSSGLAWGAGTLWMVDYETTELYELDLEASLAAGTAEVVRRWPTGLSGPSAVTAFVWGGEDWIAVSDFLGTCRTWMVPVDALRAPDSGPVKSLARRSYANGCFSQGLTVTDGLLFESIGVIGRDHVRVLRLPPSPEAEFDPPFGQGARYRVPGPMVEDLATDGESLWTSDERTYRLYRCRIPEELRRTP